MTSSALERMQTRVREVRTRALVRSWTYRQRHLAGGVWFRLRRVLAEARAAYEIADEDARRLLDEGHRAEPSGCEISPEKTIIFVDAGRLESIPSRRAIAVSLGPDFLGACAVALVRFDEPNPTVEALRGTLQSIE